ncbi:MAG: Holliday junction branch migration protein RuvA [Ndongobacter sp.]|nr:Holliday junction branch migration protein RuvA [Ndongobacter sp.]
MYAYIRGEVQGLEDGFLIVENNGIGYQILVSAQSLSHFQIGQNYKIHTLYVVREDGVNLYGFYDEEERDMFQLLTKVSSVGAKIALGILSALSVEQIRRAVLQSDVAALTQAPGIGRKTAGRILLELIDPIQKMGYVAPASEIVGKEPSADWTVAVEALVNLGYAKNEAERAVKSVASENQTLEQVVRAALRALS